MYSCLCFDDECCSFCTWFVKDISDLCCRENSPHLVGTVLHCVLQKPHVGKCFWLSWSETTALLSHWAGAACTKFHTLTLWLEFVTGYHWTQLVLQLSSKGCQLFSELNFDGMMVRVWANSLALDPALAPQPYRKQPQSTCQWFPSKSIIFPIRTAQCLPKGGVKQTSGGDGFEPWETSNILDHLPEGPVGTCSHKSVKSLVLQTIKYCFKSPLYFGQLSTDSTKSAPGNVYKVHLIIIWLRLSRLSILPLQG